ncbi:hypothetical protein PENTCL1PPCAC_16671, partial [Pristionchus entomophagus]
LQLLSMLRDTNKSMSARTRNTHESLAKALTIHAVLPIFVGDVMAVLIGAQSLCDYHSVTIEGLIHDFAVLPALVNPFLILYFVRPYRM